MKNCKMFPVGSVLITSAPVLQDYLRFILIFWDASPSALRSSLRGPTKAACVHLCQKSLLEQMVL